MNSRFSFNRMNLFTKSKRSQHEIVGFILMVVIVVIIGLFMLVFYLREEPLRYKSLNLQNFLQSVMSYTTDCFVDGESDLEDLIKGCYRNDMCGERMACDVLKETLSEILHESWLVSNQSPVNAYSVEIYYEEDRGEAEKFGEEILKLEDGNCTGSKTGADHFLHYGRGNIIITMNICYT